jgi:hypothetical protein
MEGGVTTLDPTRKTPDESRRYVVGATMEVGVWRGLAVEADVLYRHNGFSDEFHYFDFVGGAPTVTPVSAIGDRARTDVFELPVLGKYYFRRDTKLQPFVSTGYSFRKGRTNDDESSSTQTNGVVTTQKSSFSYWTPLDVGATFGAGLRWRIGAISLKPEIRYRYWNSHPTAGISKQQGDVLLGIAF